MNKQPRVYLISDGEFTKIGFSTHVETRVASLQTANAKPLRLLFSFPGTVELEQRLHRYFAAKRAHGEWFRLTAEDIEKVSTLSRPQSSPPPEERELPPDEAPSVELTPEFMRSLAERFPASDLEVFRSPFPIRCPVLLESGDELIAGPRIRRGGDLFAIEEPEAGQKIMIEALARAESLQECYELLLQGAILDAQYKTSRMSMLDAPLAWLQERHGGRVIMRSHADPSSGPPLAYLGSLQQGTRMRSFLPYVNVYEMCIEMMDGWPSPRVLIAAVKRSYSTLQMRAILVYGMDYLDLPSYSLTEDA